VANGIKLVGRPSASVSYGFRNTSAATMHDAVEVGTEAEALEAAGGALHEAAHSTVAVTVAAAASELRANGNFPRKGNGYRSADHQNAPLRVGEQGEEPDAVVSGSGRTEDRD
jgi:hypothetical protein